MLCKSCGAKVIAGSKFCSNCGVSLIQQYVEHYHSDTSLHHTDQDQSKPKQLGLKWFKFWCYVLLPLNGCISMLAFLVLFEDIGILFGVIGALQFLVAYGLHKRRMWAWGWNWLLVALTWVVMSMPSTFADVDDMIVRFLILFVFTGLIWMLPNYVYWKNRKIIFLDDN